MSKDYIKAKELGLTDKNRWEDGIEHHPMSVRVVRFLMEHDFHDYGDHFCWKFGGDGDNGETLAFQMDAFFEMLEQEKDNNMKFLGRIFSKKKRYIVKDSYDSVVIWDTVEDKEYIEVENCFHGGWEEARKKAQKIADKMN